MKKPPKRKPKHKSARGAATVATARAPASAKAGKAKPAAGGATKSVGAVVGAVRDQVRHAFSADRPNRDAHLARVARHMMQHPPERDAVLGRGPAQSAAAVYAPDERQALALLLLPFFLLAAGIGINQSLRYANRLPELAAPNTHDARPSEPRPVSTPAPARAPTQAELIRATPRVQIAQAPAPLPTAPITGRPTVAGTAPAPTVVAALNPALSPSVGPLTAATSSATRQPANDAAERRDIITPSAPTSVGALTADHSLPAGVPAAAGPTVVAAVQANPAPVDGLMGPGSRLMPVPPATLGRAAVAEDAPLDALDRPQSYAAHFPPGGICTPPAAKQAAIPVALLQGDDNHAATDKTAFGRALAAAARRQLSDLVVYTDRYRRISFPMGDVSPLYGVCTDVIIRAYRDLGLDLQALVHQTRVGSGDTSIDHRRVDTLRKFFATFGQSLPVTDFAEDYKPGDIVSYYRPQNRHSRTHIAVVSDEIGPSGRPMIIHNRGWGPQLEDGLFVDEITGHYRFSGIGGRPAAPAETGVVAAAPRGKGSPVRRVSAQLTSGSRDQATTTGTAGAAETPAKRREARSGTQPIPR